MSAGISIANGLSFSKTRIAPTPSGYLHLGNVLSFAITAGLAHRTNAATLLRIDDLDRPRIQPAYVQDIFDTLSFLDIPWQEGPRNTSSYETSWSQVHRMSLYNEALDALRASGLVFACTCSRSQLQEHNGMMIYPGTCAAKNIPLDTPGASWRLRTNHEAICVNTLHGEVQEQLPADMHYFVVRKKDRYPAYQLASVIDDVHYGIDLIVRGKDLWPSTLAQLYLSSVLGYGSFLQATFHHHLLLSAGGCDKLSKSAGATSIHYMRTQGASPADILTAASAMAGYSGRISDWHQLASATRL